MKCLNPHICNYIEVFDSIKGKKRNPRRNILETLRATVVDRYTEYDDNRDSLQLLTPNPYADDESEALIHCYGGNTAALDELKSLIRAAQDSNIAYLCQYCGVDSSPGYDHYLPKEIFPEFSVLAINLVPCCYDCNQKKRANWTDGTMCLFVNLYFDQLPSERSLFCTLNYNDGIPYTSFFLKKPATMNQTDFRRLKSHYTQLELLEKFSNCCNAIISETRNELRQLGPGMKPTMVRQLRARVNSLSTTYGANYWKVALTEAMCSSSEFLETCE